MNGQAINFKVRHPMLNTTDDAGTNKQQRPQHSHAVGTRKGISHAGRGRLNMEDPRTVMEEGHLHCKPR